MILGCSSRIRGEVVRRHIVGLETLRSSRDKSKLEWWYYSICVSREVSKTAFIRNEK